MIKVSVLYPLRPGAHFNVDYYRDVHLPMVKARMGDGCTFYTIDKGISGATRDSEPTYIAACHIYSDSVEVFENSFGPHATEIMADIPNYTNVQPILQFSEVVVGSLGKA